MLRILLWRFTFEAFNFLKVLGVRGPDTYYFAYGANLDPAVMKNRGMSIKNAETIRLPNFVLKFNHHVPFNGVGMASIESESGNSVHGILYTLPRIDERIMDCCETVLVLRWYQKRHLRLGDRLCFYYQSAIPQPNLLPAKAYLQKLVNGYRKMFPSDSDFISQLEKHPSVPEMVPSNPPHFLVDRYEFFGKALRPMLEAYDRGCMKLFIFFVYRPSVFNRTATRN
jgi:hypothetical protein